MYAEGKVPILTIQLSNVPDHILVVGLVRASTDFQQFCISPQALYLIFTDVSIPTQDLTIRGQVVEVYREMGQKVAKVI